jgi:hypothetical protein
LETETTEKLIYAYDTGVGEAQGPRIDILDVEHIWDDRPGTISRTIDYLRTGEIGFTLVASEAHSRKCNPVSF